MPRRRVTLGQDTLNWLLEPAEPSVRLFALTDLLERGASDRQVVRARRSIGRRGWASKLLSLQMEGTWWDNPSHCYIPKYSSCVWNLIVLADLGTTRGDNRVRNACEHFFKLHNVDSGGFSLRPKESQRFGPHVCLTGNMVRTLAALGYSQDSRVRRAVDWLLTQQLTDGGWNCYTKSGARVSSFKSTITSLWGLAQILREATNHEWDVSRKRACELLLSHHVFRSRASGSPIMLDFTKLHYPIHYHYDILHALRVLTSFDDPHDPRVDDAVDLLIKKRRGGVWNLEGAYRGWTHPYSANGDWVERPEEYEVIEQGWEGGRTLQLEEAGESSKWVTLQCLIVLKRLGLLQLDRPSVSCESDSRPRQRALFNKRRCQLERHRRDVAEVQELRRSA